jgi:hypothetical protein
MVPYFGEDVSHPSSVLKLKFLSQAKSAFAGVERCHEHAASRFPFLTRGCQKPAGAPKPGTAFCQV